MRTIVLALLAGAMVSCCAKKDLVSSEWWEDAQRCNQTVDKRVGCVCKDGTRSQSTGRGACSRHGGVEYWLCK